jgi:hypothetical protein
MRHTLLRTTVLACALALAACGDSLGTSSMAEKAITAQTAGTLTAAGAINAYADALKQNDFKHLIQLSVPTAEFEEMKKQFETMRSTPVAEAERKQFAESFARLTAPDAIESIMKEVEPTLASQKAQMPGYITMGAGMLMMQINSSERSAEEKEAATKAITAAQAWATKTDFADPKRARAAVTALVDTAKSLGIKTPEDVKALSFDAALEKVGLCLGGFKKALAAYDFDMDATMGSIKATDTGKPGDVKIQVTLFGQPFSTNATLKQTNGRWTN